MPIAQSEWKAWRDEIKRVALTHCSAWLYTLLPSGREERGKFIVGNVNGDPGQSMIVTLQGQYAGSWHDWATGEKGNLIDLYARVRGVDFIAASNELAEQWNIPKPAKKGGNLRLVGLSLPLVPIPADATYNADGTPDWTPRDDAQITGAWCYLDRDFQPLHWRVRLEKDGERKQVKPLTWCRNSETGDVGWQVKGPPTPIGLYGVEWMVTLPDAPLLIVQGEKTCDAARRLLPDWVVVTAAGGDANVSTKHVDWSPAIDRKTRKVVWPDADASGIAAASTVAILVGDCEVVKPDPAWRKGWDLADAEIEGWTTDRVLAWIDGHAETAAHERIECMISGSDLDANSHEVFAAVAKVNDDNGAPSLFRTDSEANPVAIVRGNGRLTADKILLRQWLTARIRFLGWAKGGNIIPTMPLEPLLENLLAYYPSPLPLLRRMVSRPVFCATGELIATEGYHEKSGILYRPPADLSGIEPHDDIDAAMVLIDDLLADFHFDRASDRAHLFALLLQPMFRELIDGPTPLYRFEAPQPGTGKTLLFEIAAKLLFDGMWPFITPPATDDEWSKALLGHLLNGPEAILIDNCHHLQSQHLAAALTAWPYWTGRVLYRQGSFHVPVRNLWAATMNNPEFSEEMYRRSVRIRIVPGDGVERPELRRDFRHDPILVYVTQERRALAEALLTLGVAAKGALKPFLTRRLGSYEQWAQVMGGVLEALGIEGFLVREADDMAEDRQETAWHEFLTAWWRQHEEREVRAKDLIDIAQETDLNLGTGKAMAQQQKLGALLIAHRDKRSAGFTVRCYRSSYTHGMVYSLAGAQLETQKSEEMPF